MFSIVDETKKPLSSANIRSIRADILKILQRKSAVPLRENPTVSQKLQDWYIKSDTSDRQGLKQIVNQFKLGSIQAMQFTVPYMDGML